MEVSLLVGTFEIDPQEEGDKDHQDAQQGLHRQQVPVDETGEQDADGLPRGHDEREDDGTKYGYGVENEELADGRAYGEDGSVEGKFRVAEEKEEGREEGASEKERPHGEDTGEEVYAKHHLNGRDPVRSEELRLPIRREAVKGHVPQQDDDTSESGLGGGAGVVLIGGCRVGGQEEHPNTHGEQRRRKVLVPGIRPVGNNFPHQHDWDDLGGLGQDLCREADELQSLVLAPAAEGVGYGGVGVLVEGGPAHWISSGEEEKV